MFTSLVKCTKRSEQCVVAGIRPVFGIICREISFKPGHVFLNCGNPLRELPEKQVYVYIICFEVITVKIFCSLFKLPVNGDE